jgi:hypothetical protein
MKRKEIRLLKKVVYMRGYTLYNNYIPIINSYEEMKKELIENPEYYYLDYAIEDEEMKPNL